MKKIYFQEYEIMAEGKEPKSKRVEIENPAANQTAIAFVKLAQLASVEANKWAVDKRQSEEIENISPEICARAPKDGGVLLVLGIEEWEIEDPTGMKGKSFLSIHIGGAGKNPQEVLMRYLTTPQLTVGAAAGWKRNNKYIWATVSGEDDLSNWRELQKIGVL